MWWPLLFLQSASCAPVWFRGSFTALSVGGDASLSLVVGTALRFASPSPPLAPATNEAGSSVGPWGPYDFILFRSASGSPLYEARYHGAIDAFTFHYSVDAAPFPFFGAADVETANAGLISYSESYMLPGARSTLSSCAGVPPPQPRAPGDCPSLSGEWCCEPVSVTQVGNVVSSIATWGNGTGSVASHFIHMNFTNVGAQVGTISADCGTIRWAPAGSTWTRTGAPTSATDGPLFIFPATPSAGALAFSPLDNFTVSSAGCGDVTSSNETTPSPGFGAMYRPAGAPPAGAPLSLLLVGRPGLKRTTVAWGAAMRRAYATDRRRGVGSRALSYWSDNAAGYSFWSVPTELDKWGQPEAIFRALYKGYKAQGIPVVQWEVDSNMIPGVPEHWSGGWCWKDWRHFNLSLYPSGGGFSENAVGGAPMAYYVSAFCQNNVHTTEGYRFVNVTGIGPAGVAHPEDACKSPYRAQTRRKSARHIPTLTPL